MEQLHKTRYITRLVLFIAVTAVIELIGLPQPATGPLVNFMLILTTLLLDVYGGLALGCLTPLLALLRGQLPIILAPLVPLIMTGNALYVIIFYLLCCGGREKNLPLGWRAFGGLLLAACAKFAWFYMAIRYLLPLWLAHPLPDNILTIMLGPQLLTAAIGGAAAILFYTLLWQRKIIFIGKAR